MCEFTGSVQHVAVSPSFDVSEFTCPFSVSDAGSRTSTLEQKQTRLSKLYHASTCEFAKSGERCPYEPRCAAIRRSYLHVLNCSCPGSCSVPGCGKSWSVLNHYRDCTIETCGLCMVVPIAGSPMASFRPINSVKCDAESKAMKSVPRMIQTHPRRKVLNEGQDCKNERIYSERKTSVNIWQEAYDTRSDCSLEEGPPYMRHPMPLSSGFTNSEKEKNLLLQGNNKKMVTASLAALSLLPPPPPPSSPPPRNSVLISQQILGEPRKKDSLRACNKDHTTDSISLKPLLIGTNISEYGIEIFIASQDDLDCKVRQDKNACRGKRMLSKPIRKAQNVGRPPLPTNALWFAT